jgi:hydrogen peroxide-dependent heme synthase
MSISESAHPPATLEGWYALHQIFRVDPQRVSPTRLQTLLRSTAATLEKASTIQESHKSRKSSSKAPDAGWSCVAKLVGSTSDVMIIHFRESLDAIDAAQSQVAGTSFRKVVEPVYAFLSVTEAGLYHITADLARRAEDRGGKVGDEEFTRELADRAASELGSPHVRRRLYPDLPSDKPYVSFYPMSKRRNPDENWYSLSLDERSRLMQAHGWTGRRYAGKVQQVITGAIGLDAWEWGVTLFASDPLEFKKLVTDMRFDEVSAKYAEFGNFYVGKIVSA